MATMQSRDTRTFLAGGDLSSAQFKFVTLAAGGAVNVTASLGGPAIGVLLNNPAATGRAATVCVSGSVMIKCGGTIAAGAQVASTGAGFAQLAGSAHIILGYAREAGIAGQVIEIEFITGGNAAA